MVVCELHSQGEIAMPISTEPFQRSRTENVTTKAIDEQLRHVAESLSISYPDSSFHEAMPVVVERLLASWKKRDAQSEIAFKGLLLYLEYGLSHTYDAHQSFELLVSLLGFNTIQFWKAAVPFIFDSDLSRGTKYRDSLLFALTLHDVNTGKNKLRELYAAVPGLRKSLLGVHAKRFGEKYHHLQKRLSRSSSLNSIASMDSDDEVASTPHGYLSEDDEAASSPRISTGGLADNHFQQRVINVSNAPPVSLKREKCGDWQIKQGSGGLVSCVDPVMSKDHDNVWLANLGMNLKEKRKSSMETAATTECAQPATNTLGLPIIKQAIAEVLFHVLAEDDTPDTNVNDDQKKAREEMSLLGVLNNYNRGNYKLNPVIVQEEDYNVYYGGISNGLLWPALHNLPEYIVQEYSEKSNLLNEHWCAYVRVNYQFALDAVRNSRAQDFIWIHDYHLMLTGMIMQSLDSNLEVGFFLHIPFQPPEEFFTRYQICGLAVIRGLLRFTKVGFQTHRDRTKFVEVVQKYLRNVKVSSDGAMDTVSITYEGWTCSLGVFPVSIKNDDFLQYVHLEETQKTKNRFREKILGSNPAPDARFFFSVERFDYTKGIKEKLTAWQYYLRNHRDRIGKDTLYQIAVTNRRSVDTYRVYQDECLAIADAIEQEFASETHPEWRPIVFETDGLPRSELVAAYLAMDIGVVTPMKDGMNLVAKEMLVCNPSASLVLSTGAGSEIQFANAGMYGNYGDHNYFRVAELENTEDFANAFYAAALESKESRQRHGKLLHDFIMANDIERWSVAFLDPSWAHQGIRPTQVDTLEDFFSLMMRTRNVRRQIVDRVLKGIPIKPHFGISLRNAKEALENSCRPKSHILELKASEDFLDKAVFDIKNELDELEKDLSFMEYINSEDVENVERFVDTLTNIESDLKREVNEAVALLFAAEHFDYFFTDRDGTLKSYACSYSSSIQPAYSGVIQAQFARRCAQTCAIITTAPLLNIGVLDVCTIPPGYYYYGASGGREWYIEPTNKFKDSTLSSKDLDLINQVFLLITQLLEQNEYRAFKWLGSGLQNHYGHITIGHQDIYKSVRAEVSTALLNNIKEIVNSLDPSAESLIVKQTELDTKIMLKDKCGEVFNKRQGLRLLCEKMDIDISSGNILLCGDSESDLPMLEECLSLNAKGVSTIWVTTNSELRKGVKDLCSRYGNSQLVFVSCPEVLLGAMAQATIRDFNLKSLRLHD